MVMAERVGLSRLRRAFHLGFAWKDAPSRKASEGVGFGEGSAGFKAHNTLIIRVIKQYCHILFHYS